MFIPRIAYAVWLLTEIRDNHPNEVDISVMYDVACTLVRHLKVIYKECVMQYGLPLTILQANDAEGSLASMNYAVPAFHAYAHTPSCQVIAYAILTVYIPITVLL